MILGHMAACTIESHINGTQSIETHEVISVHDLQEIPGIEAFMIQNFFPKDQLLTSNRKSAVIFMPAEKNFTGYAKKVDDLNGIGC